MARHYNKKVCPQPLGAVSPQSESRTRGSARSASRTHLVESGSHANHHLELPGLLVAFAAIVHDALSLVPVDDNHKNGGAIRGLLIAVSNVIAKAVRPTAIAFDARQTSTGFPAARYLDPAKSRDVLLQLQQVPEVPVKVLEDRHCAVRLVRWRTYEVHALARVSAVITPEVIRVQEQENAAAGLVPDTRSLFVSDGTRQE